MPKTIKIDESSLIETSQWTDNLKWFEGFYTTGQISPSGRYLFLIPSSPIHVIDTIQGTQM